jgi:Glycosyl hydrolases family 2, TIM barrel domain
MFNRIQSLILLLTILMSWNTPMLAEAIPVELKKTAGGWQLLRDGKPYFIRGAGGNASLSRLAAAGGNSIRTWGSDDIDDLLDEAHSLGLSVTIGIWLGHERHGFDYNNEDQVKAQLETARKAVMRYRDHPALLLWAVGNEMEGFDAGDNPVIWKAVNDIATMIKQLDPAHPTMTVTAEIGGERIHSIEKYATAIDIHGINAYGGSPAIAERYHASAAKKPYILTEFGPPGAWEVAKSDWGAAYELTSTEKAQRYREAYQQSVLNAPGLALGSYVFIWGYKMEATATWFGMFLPDGSPLAAVDVMTEIWSGQAPENLAPAVEPLLLKGSSQVDPGSEVQVVSKINDAEAGALKVRWVLRRELQGEQIGGDYRAMLPDIEDAIIESRADGALIRMPTEPGPYRLFLYVYDDAGKAATANVPLLVKGEARTAMPFPVYDDSFEGMPWVPSGWMGSYEELQLDGDHANNPHRGNSCIKMRYRGKFGWAGVAWQHPANNWGNTDGGFDVGSATALEFWARGKWGDEHISAGVGLIAKDKPYPDSGLASIDDIVLEKAWKRYVIPLDDTDLSSIKTGFYVSIKGQQTSVTVYLDSIRFITE